MRSWASAVACRCAVAGERMRIGFAVTLPEQIDRFAPVARRLAGARWVVPHGRWPSSWLDSRQWTLETLHHRERASAISPAGELDLIVLPGGVASAAVRDWLHPSGAIVSFGDEWAAAPESAAQFAAGASWMGASGGILDAIVGDPRLDMANAAATRARVRSSLGLSGEGDRPCIVIRAEFEHRALPRFAHALAQLRTDADLIVAPANVCWLHQASPIPSELHGPGIQIIRDSLRWGELLAAADIVVAELGVFAADAVALGKPVVLMGSRSLRTQRDPRLKNSALLGWIDQLVGVCEPSDLPAAIEEAVTEATTIRRELAAKLVNHCLAPDARAASRLATKLREFAQLRAIERTLLDLSLRA